MRTNKGQFAKGHSLFKGIPKPKRTDEHKKKLSLAGIGRIVTEETRRKLSLIGKNKSPELISKLRDIAKQRNFKPPVMIGRNNPNWKGGITPTNVIIRGSLKYKEWRKAVYNRDKYTCVLCGQKSGKLNADHIKPFSLYPNLRFDVNNGRTLCESCHKKTDTYGNKKKHIA